MTTKVTEGPGLEARMQRIFLAQGILAERGLYPSASPDHRMLATDIDVLISEYGSGFHLTRRHAECKGGRAPVLDRILWLNGVRSLLGADTSYLVSGSPNHGDAVRFGRGLDVQVLSVQQLGVWESALGIPDERWPCRSDYGAFDLARHRWAQLSRDNRGDDDWLLLREVLAFIHIDSWPSFKYASLNRLLRSFNLLAEAYPRLQGDRDKALCCRYCTSALLVRFGQYLLSVCLDVDAVDRSEMSGYVIERLTYGDQEPGHVQGLVRSTVEWVREGLAEKGVPLPAQVDVARLYDPPRYGEEFVELIRWLLQRADEARFLPIALEVSQFDDGSSLEPLPRLKVAAEAGDNAAAIVKGFIVRALSVPKERLDGVGVDLRNHYKKGPTRKASARSTNPNQLPLVGDR